MSDVKGGNGLDSSSFSSRLQNQQRKERRGGEKKSALCSCFVFYTVLFLQIVSWGGGGAQGGTSPPETRKCHEAHPEDFTVCLQAVALAAAASSLPHFYVSAEEKNLLSVIFFVYFCQKKGNFKRMFWSKGPEEQLKEFFFTYSRCSLTAPRGATPFIQLFFPAQFISSACVYVAILGGLLSANHTHSCCSFFSRANRSCLLIYIHNNTIMRYPIFYSSHRHDCIDYFNTTMRTLAEGDSAVSICHGKLL